MRKSNAANFHAYAHPCHFPAVSIHPTRGDRFVAVSSSSICYTALLTLCTQGGGTDNLWVYLHDMESGQELFRNKGHHGPVHSVRFTPSGERYASGYVGLLVLLTCGTSFSTIGRKMEPSACSFSTLAWSLPRRQRRLDHPSLSRTPLLVLAWVKQKPRSR